MHEIDKGASPTTTESLSDLQFIQDNYQSAQLSELFEAGENEGPLRHNDSWVLDYQENQNQKRLDKMNLGNLDSNLHGTKRWEEAMDTFLSQL